MTPFSYVSYILECEGYKVYVEQFHTEILIFRYSKMILNKMSTENIKVIFSNWTIKEMTPSHLALIQRRLFK